MISFLACLFKSNDASLQNEHLEVYTLEQLILGLSASAIIAVWHYKNYEGAVGFCLLPEK